VAGVAESQACEHRGHHRFVGRGTYGFHCKGATTSGVPVLEFTHPESAVRLHGYGIW
jgi:hypothetical protein